MDNLKSLTSKNKKMIKSWKHQTHSQNWKHKRLQVFWRMMSPQHLTRRPHCQNLTLSKQKTLILPQKLILGGLIQKILDFLSRFWAYTVPTVMAAGKAGGTTTVTMSNTRRIVFPAGSWRKKDPFEPRKLHLLCRGASILSCMGPWTELHLSRIPKILHGTLKELHLWRISISLSRMNAWNTWTLVKPWTALYISWVFSTGAINTKLIWLVYATYPILWPIIPILS